MRCPLAFGRPAGEPRARRAAGQRRGSREDAVADSFTFTASDGQKLVVDRWLPAGTPEAVVHVAHGAAEHAQRYGRMAERLAGAGYAVYADDHRGHGRTAGTLDRAGIAGPDGWNGMVRDTNELIDH